MGWLRRRVRALERANRGEMITIRQKDGTTKRFWEEALAEAFVINARRFCGEDVPAHPLTEACDNAADAGWRESFYASPRVVDSDGNSHDPLDLPLEDLSQQASE